MTTPIILSSIGFIILIIIIINNTLIRKKNSVENTFSAIDVQLKKRYDLIPNLVSCVNKYMKHEKELLTQITKLRTNALNTNDTEKIVDFNNQISKQLGSLLISVENYPDLKASNDFIQLQKSLNEIESQISAARRSYNMAVTSFNNSVEMFPMSIIANIKKYTRKETFQIDESERKNINIDNPYK